MDLDARIAQWEKMTQEVPDGMAWFSLANAYNDADRPTDAADAYREAIRLDPNLSRAYQLLGHLLIQQGQDDEAAETLTKGYPIAASRGDVMPQRAMQSLLEKLGRPVPKVETPAAAASTSLSDDQVLDRRTGRPGSRMAGAPMRGPLGQFIVDHYSQETWREWIAQGTKVINELRLDFSREDHQQTYDQHMMEWLGISQEDVDAYAASTSAN